uniref:Uncharacterized protein n=1 Tax=Setaria italica TaxID=4555 RepID=K3YZJ1_SETIT
MLLYPIPFHHLVKVMPHIIWQLHPSGRHTYLRLETGVNDSVKINT